MDLTKDQLNRLKKLGIISKNQSISPQTTDKLLNQTISSTQIDRLLTSSNLPKNTSKLYLPLLSLSGLTLLSFGSLVLLKSKEQSPSVSTPSTIHNLPSTISPTQVPKSIQHYLLSSQQFFTEALQLQNSSAGPESVISLLNQSILVATEAIKSFPNDYRGYEQRGRIYQSILNSQPQFLAQAIADFSAVQKLNPSSAEITRTLASLFAKQGDTQNTLAYLTQTVVLEPTRAQNFYDLARLQQQIGLLPQALDTYNRLIPLISDLSQKSQIESEKLALENLVKQSGTGDLHGRPSPEISTPTISVASPLLQAKLITPGLPAKAKAAAGLIIAAPETSKNITINSLTEGNALSGTATLPANQKTITLTNSNLKSTSQVYLTITKGGKNQNLQVLSKSDNSFTAGLPSATNENIEFKWWIIN